jgi:tRNA (guanine-N7-)-methyltransferase
LRFDLPQVGRLDPREVFPAAPSAVLLELGFGGGEHLAAMAEAHPAAGLIGAEIFENGIAKLVAEIERRKLDNIRIFMGDGRLLAAALAERSIAGAFILFPDPWPKERHKKRRVLSATLLDDLARVLGDEAELRLATDDADYADAMRAALAAHADFRRRGEWRERPGDWPGTRYEQKALAAGRTPAYLSFERRLRGR